MRLFLGVEIDEAMKAAAFDAAERLRQRLRREIPGLQARWVQAANLHITLSFIGEVPDRTHDDVVAALQNRPFETRSFVLAIAGAGVFPLSGRPRAFWLGVRQGEAALAALYREVGDRLAPLRFQPDRRPYSPHLTIARVKEAPPGASRLLAEALAGLRAECGECRVSAITLFRSRLSPHGAVYESLLRVPLIV